MKFIPHWLNPFARLPSVTEFRRWEKETQFTPDIATLEMKVFWPILEYGDAMRDFPNYSLIGEHSFFYAHAFTVSRKFVMRSYKQKYPLAFLLSRRNKSPKLARVRGELHYVEADGIVKLDNLRQNGVKFQRVRVPVDIPHREHIKITDSTTGHYRQVMTNTQHYKQITAFVYIALPFWETQLDGGFDYPFCERVEPSGKKSIPFYAFKK